MKKPGAISMLRLPDNAIHDGAALASATAARSRRCKVDMVAGSGPCPIREVTCLLRSRLRLAALVLLGGFTFFLLRLVFDGQGNTVERWSLPFHAVVAGVTAVLAFVLWSSH